jgi:hypothetical protein
MFSALQSFFQGLFKAFQIHFKTVKANSRCFEGV